MHLATHIAVAPSAADDEQQPIGRDELGKEYFLGRVKSIHRIILASGNAKATVDKTHRVLVHSEQKSLSHATQNCELLCGPSLVSSTDQVVAQNHVQNISWRHCRCAMGSVAAEKVAYPMAEIRSPVPQIGKPVDKVQR